MANFGLSRLTVVAPFEPHWREARSAVQSSQILENARETSTLADAIASDTLVLGTASLTYRTPEQPVLHLPDACPTVRQELARGGRVALVFGSEKHGLTRADLAFCHRLLVIPTSDIQPSMNLGQAVAVCLYELSSRLGEPVAALTAPEPPVTSADLGQLAQLVEETMVAANYSPAGMRGANRHDVELMLRRLSPSGRDLRRILGLFRRILWRLKEGSERL
jgi:tRNA/rRNA methyltransferase